MIRRKLNEKVYITVRPKIAMQAGTEQRQLAYMASLTKFGDLVFWQYYMAFASHQLFLPSHTIIVTWYSLFILAVKIHSIWF